jgi:hypothetical protein
LIAARANAASYDFYVASNFDQTFVKFQNVPASGGYGSPNVQQIGFDSEQFSQSRTPYLTRFKFAPSDYAAVFASVSPVSGQTGAAATISAFSGGVVTLTGLTGMTTASVGHYLTLTGAATASNNGAFQITAYVSATSVKIANPAGVFPDANSGSISWVESIGVSDTTPLWIQIVQNNLGGGSNPAEAPFLILPYSSQPNRAILLSGNAPSATTIYSSLELQLPMQVNNIQIQNNGGADLYVAFEPTGPEFTVNPVSTSALNIYETYVASAQLFVRGNGSTVAFNFIGALRNNPIT